MATSKAVTLLEEMIVEILYRLPVKSRGLCRCVSKQWYNILSHPKFIKFHFNQQEEKLIFVSASHALYTITINHNPQNGIMDAISRKLNFQEDNWLSVAGSSNGLLLLENQQHIIFLINPTTLEYHTIPTFHLALSQQSSNRMYGLGYDFATDDYKVVNLSRYRGNTDSSFVDVYSAKVGLWRRLESLPYDKVGGSSGVLVNGALHWFACRKPSPYLIVAFDLTNDKFLEVPTPDTIDKNDLDWYNLTTLRGCLCMFILIQEEIVVWMMREYRVKESWTNTFRVVVPDVKYCLTPVFLMRDDVVIDVDIEKLIVYDMKEGQWRDMMVDGVTTAYEMAKTFRQSLVSPTFGRGTRGNFIA